ncbi:response regulator [Actinoplanes sp. NEAU-A12]|uniref:Response regulator n=1 Tax=Actinoplanes sandaracinus TaxID=3045177 RepID=A0ABT6WME8_9ACTN|nr:response regulator [Actinoplanes sandaracinus]MDI6100894.1 response regulator [Actinoplanes sandaracinus]
MRTELYRSGNADTDSGKPAVLLVDDEESVLATLSLQLGKDHRLLLAGDGDEALRLLAENGPVAAVISDMRMPGMDGIELLGRIQVDYPDIMRILHTGYGDMSTAIAAINAGGVYRYLPKPASRADICETVKTAIDRHDHAMAERRMLDTTLRASLQALFGILELSSPVGFARAGRIRVLVGELVHEMELDGLWEIEVAAMASQLGAVTVPPEVLKRMEDGAPLSFDEQAMVSAMPGVVLPLINDIPMLEDVVATVRGLAGEEPPPGGWNALVEGAISVVRAAIEYETAESRTNSPALAIASLTQRGMCAPHVLAALRRLKGVEGTTNAPQAYAISELQVGMRLAEDVRAVNGLVLIGRGTVVTEVMLDRLVNFSRVVGLVEPVLTAT